MALTNLSAEIGNYGERVVADNKDFSYYAHLSIYDFALPFAAGRHVLDAGCGTGYGSCYLASNGASEVTAVDASSAAVGYCEANFRLENLRYSVMDLGKPLPFSSRSFPTIFSSNVMEHVAEIDLLLSECARIVEQDGTVIIAVPPIPWAGGLKENLINVFHITNLTPFGWYTKIGRFFGRVRCHGHHPRSPFDDPIREQAEIMLGSDTVMRQTDFVFPPYTIDDLNQLAPNITAVFVATEPRQDPLRPSLDEELPREWHVGAIFAQLLNEERARAIPPAAVPQQPAAPLEPQVDEALVARLAAADTRVQQCEATAEALQRRIREIEGSTSWRITAPLRTAAKLLRGRPGSE